MLDTGEKKSTALMYKYLQYNPIFKSSLISYIEERDKNSLNCYSSNKKIYLVQDTLFKYKTWNDVNTVDFG